MRAPSRKKLKYVQRTLDLLLHGGKRPGAGRKKQKGSGVPHRAREDFHSTRVLHVTLKRCDGLGSLRGAMAYHVLRLALAKGLRFKGLRIVHYVVMPNHVHLIVEADDRRSLSRGMQGLKIRIALALNKLWKRTGTVWAERYHERRLASPPEVRNALCYVLNNGLHHGQASTPGLPDYYSSGDSFDGWLERFDEEPEVASIGIVAKARSWLLRKGWKRCGRIGLSEVPG